MDTTNGARDGLCRQAALHMRAHHLLSLVCTLAGTDCPLLPRNQAERMIERLREDPTLTIRLDSDADEIPHYASYRSGPPAPANPYQVFNRKRDLDVFQRLGLVPGSVRRARYLYELLFERITTLQGICGYDRGPWRGCSWASHGGYERIREQGWQAMVYQRSEAERERYRLGNISRIQGEDKLFIRPHHLMCIACWYAGGQGQTPRPNDTIYEILQRMREDPDIPVVLVEGCCEACDCCDGFHPDTGRCVHSGGLIRDYKKDLDVLQALGLMPWDALPAKALYDLLFERIPSTRMICGYGDGVETSHEWRICGDPAGHPGYAATRERGIL